MQKINEKMGAFLERDGVIRDIHIRLACGFYMYEIV
ncbi:hypothetical protein BCQ_1671 [Bacillus cereus Q1]|uniref:Uncharacterized protein n=1 Tax=Bacillus cereus (strain Q1) TaxID=361100 RepID=B9IWA6_BACCQ|nr:hypothetical protein BCQ_1671 [Bacillus cereus Q1]